MGLEEGFESHIEIYLRMRPHEVGIATYKINEEQDSVQWSIPRQAQLGMINHQREHYNFSFTGVFDMDAKQDVVFESVAKKVVLGALDGYNGTIFAYGQTGSGKTYTITGGAEKYAERGIIPRAISLIFSDLANRNDYTYILHFTYVEIYNETGYDLLDPNHETKALEDLPKVTMMEDDESHIHLRNLSLHLATNEEAALNLLFVGDTNRMISATPMNMASSRSHCIFTITIEARKAGEDIVRRSKLHLVDLAGSERVSKTKVDGQILREAKYINLSLHFLEQVIIALQERSQGKPRDHIPYRNSMMTSMLRDSLGGNCRTVMIAAVSTAQDQLEETISTCRFAQRVAMVSNKVEINEEIDPNMLIKRLKQEIMDLKDEINLLKASSNSVSLECPKTSGDIEAIRTQIINYVRDDSPDAQFKYELNIVYIRKAFHVFKLLLKQLENTDCLHATDLLYQQGERAPQNFNDRDSNMCKEIQDLKYELQQRDNEINILVSFIRKHENTTLCNQKGSKCEVGVKDLRSISNSIVQSLSCSRTHDITKSTPQVASPHSLRRPNSESHSTDKEFTACISNKLVLGRKQCFEVFCSNYLGMQSINENKALLKAKYGEAKALGDQVNRARENINKLKINIEKERVDRAMQSLIEGKGQDYQPNMQDEHLIRVIDNEKMIYKDGFAKLRDHKREIEHLHILLERSRVKLHDDFKTWLSLLQTPSCTPNNQEGDFLLESLHMEDNTSHPLSACSTSSTLSDTSMLIPFQTIKQIVDIAPKGSQLNHNTTSKLVIDELPNHRDTKVPHVKIRKDTSISQSQQNVFEDFEFQFSKKKPNHCGEQTRTPSIEAFSLDKGKVVEVKKCQDKKIMLIGNDEADADVLAFYQARSQILNLNHNVNPTSCV